MGTEFSLIIFAGIVARLPAAVAQTFDLYKVGQLSFILLVALPSSWLWLWPPLCFLRVGDARCQFSMQNV